MTQEIDEAALEEIKAALPPCGIIYEFGKMDRAKAFALEVKRRFGIDSRVFDNAEEAANSHFYPWTQNPPVVHVDRPYWFTEPDTKAWDEAWKLEDEIDALAEKFDGQWIGT
jgi:hypothetical protein